MSKYYLWLFDTKEEADEYVNQFVGDPFVSPGNPIQRPDGKWTVNVTQYEID
jgi:hypothetical protein